MAIVDLLMPKMGESIMEATILKWHKQPGDPVMQDETLLDIATDKVDSEVPSTTAGVLEEILFQVNDVVPVGAVIARIKTEVAEPVPGEVKPLVPEEKDNPVMASHPDQAPDAVKSNGNRFYSPLVLNIA